MDHVTSPIGKKEKHINIQNLPFLYIKQTHGLYHISILFIEINGGEDMATNGEPIWVGYGPQCGLSGKWSESSNLGSTEFVSALLRFTVLDFLSLFCVCVYRGCVCCVWGHSYGWQSIQILT